MRCAAILLASSALLVAEARLPYILSDGMVVQRDLPVRIWGHANPGEAISVSFRGRTEAVKADRLGQWSVALPPGGAGGPFEVQVKAANTIVLKDVLVGDVWIAAGQSNMEWPVDWSADPAKEAAAANFPSIRLARTMHRVSDYPLDAWVGERWRPCTPQTVKTFSAVAYHFAREVHLKTGVPVGVIQSAWGGTPVEAWTSLRGLSSDASLMSVFQEWAKLTGQHRTNLLEHTRQGDPSVELRRRPGGQWMPGGLYNAMIAPLTPYAIKGAIWYQGEANTAPERAPIYGRVYEAMIRDWRTAWGLGDFPFLFVQLANFRGAEDAMWPEVREAQRQALSLVNTAMAVTIDIGTPADIHPRNKREVGRRLSLAAFAKVYGQAGPYSGPLFRGVTPEGPRLRIWFEHAAGLTARGALKGTIEVAGLNGRYVPAQARIDGETVVVWADGVDAVNVRYAWKDNPIAPLFNAAGLPASPFRSAR